MAEYPSTCYTTSNRFYASQVSSVVGCQRWLYQILKCAFEIPDQRVISTDVGKASHFVIFSCFVSLLRNGIRTLHNPIDELEHYCFDEIHAFKF